MFRGTHHTAISTPDLARSVAFYRDLFGFEVILEMDWLSLKSPFAGFRNTSERHSPE